MIRASGILGSVLDLQHLCHQSPKAGRGTGAEDTGEVAGGCQPWWGLDLLPRMLRPCLATYRVIKTEPCRPHTVCHCFAPWGQSRLGKGHI